MDKISKEDIITISNIFTFIHYNYPKLNFYGYKFNDNQFLDTINPALFCSFR